MSEEEFCFVIMSFSDELKKVYDSAIKPAVKSQGLKCTRVDEIEGSGSIVRRIVECVNDAKVIIADLTDQRPNVFYELGMSHALRNNVIVLAQDIKRDVPFDVASYKVIEYANTIAGGQELEREIKSAIGTLDEWSKKPSNPVQDFLPVDTRPVPHSEHDAVKETLAKTQNELAGTKAKLTEYQNQEKEFRLLKSEHETVKQTLKETQDKLSDAETKYETQENELRRLKYEHETLKQTLENIQNELSRTEEKLAVPETPIVSRRPGPVKREWERLRDEIEQTGFREGAQDVLHFADRSSQMELWKQLAAMVDDLDGESIADYLRSLAPEGMVLIPAGKFLMGSEDEEAESNENPVHPVHVDAFYMDMYPVTNEQFKTFIDANPELGKDQIPDEYAASRYLSDWNGTDYPSEKGNHPVAYVSWYAAAAYAQWVGKRLPTESEWEKAARGGLEGKKYPWGDEIDESKANYGRNIGDTTAVGSYQSNGYGLYDMAGNVLEWCMDEWDSDFYSKSSDENPVSGEVISFENDDFTNVKTARVLRGGSWGSNPSLLRVSYRDGSGPSLTSTDVGFRCAGL